MAQGYLPLGTVVMLEGGSHRVMITGYGQTIRGQEHVVYDYAGCLWPEGVQGPDQSLAFQHDQIREVCFRGYETEGQQMFIARVEAALAEMRRKEMQL